MNSNTEITSDPNANPAIIFTAPSTAVISTGVINGDIQTTSLNTILNLNGSTTINGNIGSLQNPIFRLTTGVASPVLLRTQDGDIYILNGDIVANNFFINAGLVATGKGSLIELGGNVLLNNFIWRGGGVNTFTTLDLHGHSLRATNVVLNTVGGLLRISSTIISGVGQSNCNSSGMTAGCIFGVSNLSQSAAGVTTRTLPSSLELQVRVANGVTLVKGTKYALLDFTSGNNPVLELTTPIKSLFNDVVFTQDRSSNTEDLVIMISELPAPVAPVTPTKVDPRVQTIIHLI